MDFEIIFRAAIGVAIAALTGRFSHAPDLR
jgi:hypothetical protein